MFDVVDVFFILLMTLAIILVNPPCLVCTIWMMLR